MNKKQVRKIRKLRARVARLEAQMAELEQRIIVAYPQGGYIREGYTINGVPNLTTQATTTSEPGMMDFSVPAWPSASSTAPIIETDGKYVWVNADGQRRRHSRASGTEDEEE